VRLRIALALRWARTTRSRTVRSTILPPAVHQYVILAAALSLDPHLPDRSLQVIRPWAQFQALLGEHPAYFDDPLEVVIAEAV